MKAYEETWRVNLAEDCVESVDDAGSFERVLHTDEDLTPEGQTRSRELLRLAAQAPAMARLLMRLHADEDCRILQPGGKAACDFEDGMRAVLRAAGVIEPAPTPPPPPSTPPGTT